jgi:RIO kinase 1
MDAPNEDYSDSSAEEGEGDERPKSAGSTEDASAARRPGGDAIYQGLTKVERKTKVKEDKRAKRAEKIPKHVKKSKVAKGAVKR